MRVMKSKERKGEEEKKVLPALAKVVQKGRGRERDLCKVQYKQYTNDPFPSTSLVFVLP